MLEKTSPYPTLDEFQVANLASKAMQEIIHGEGFRDIYKMNEILFEMIKNPKVEANNPKRRKALKICMDIIKKGKENMVKSIQKFLKENSHYSVVNERQFIDWIDTKTDQPASRKYPVRVQFAFDQMIKQNKLVRSSDRKDYYFVTEKLKYE